MARLNTIEELRAQIAEDVRSSTSELEKNSLIDRYNRLGCEENSDEKTEEYFRKKRAEAYKLGDYEKYKKLEDLVEDKWWKDEGEKSIKPLGWGTKPLVLDPCREFKNPFEGKLLEFEYVGSRVTCVPPPEDSDQDILILTDQLYRLVEDCKNQGYKGGEVYFAPGGESASDFVSLRMGDINLIVTENKQWFDKFMAATHVCKTLNVMEKHRRILVFQAVLYGMVIADRMT